MFSNDFGAHAGLPPCTQEGRRDETTQGGPAPAQPETKNHCEGGGRVLEGGVGLQHKTKKHDR